MKTFRTNGMKVRFDNSPEVQREVFNRVIAFYAEHETFTGESIMQSDGPQLDAAEFFADLADEVLHFKVTYDD